MRLSSSSIIAVAELVAYIPAIVVALFVCIRHGFSRSSGWYYTFSLCLIRVIGTVCQLLTLTNKSAGLEEAVLVLNHIGLTPLLLATLGMLSRIADWINVRSSSPPLAIANFRLAQLLVVLGAVFGIIGIVNGTSNHNTTTTTRSPSAWSHVAVICYLATYAMLVFIMAKSLPFIRLIPDKEHLLAHAVGLALPLVFIRLLYQILIVFVHRGDFVRTDGPILILVFMSTLEEFLVVFIFLLVGLRLDRLDVSEQGPILSRPWKNRGRRRRRVRRGVYRESGAPMTEEHQMYHNEFIGRNNLR